MDILNGCKCGQAIGQCARCGGNFTADHVCPIQYWTEEEWNRHKEKVQSLVDLLKNKEQQMPNNDIEINRQALNRVQELVNEIKKIAQSQPSIEYINWENVAEDLLYFQSSLNLESARLDEHNKD